MSMMSVEQAAESRAPGPVSQGMPAPEFEAKTTRGKVKLSDYAGKWAVLFSHRISWR